MSVVSLPPLPKLLTGHSHETNSEGFSHQSLDDQLRGYPNPVISIRVRAKGSVYTEFGRIERQYVTLADKAAYIALCAIPHADRLRSATVVSESTVWTARPDAGLFRRVVTERLRQGIPTIVVGTVKHRAHFPPSLVRAANNQMEITAAFARDNGYDDTQMLATGSSRADAISKYMSAMSLHKPGAMKVIGINGEAPVFLERLGAYYIANHAPHLFNELRFVQALGSLSLLDLWEYRRTIDLSRHGVAYTAMTVVPLTNGVIAEVIKRMPPDLPGYQHIYEGDFLSADPSHWSRAFAKHPNIKITHSPGGHVSVASEAAFQRKLERDCRLLGLDRLPVNWD